ncbi:DUF1254 domain-containing protein [Pseudomonas sp. HMSC75E02]|uniref:DUF1254 domain-containing protein n=1 Tax=Pseudomonas sp. HMSC75E02 TaxID=1608908 RepID=UPI000B05EC5C
MSRRTLMMPLLLALALQGQAAESVTMEPVGGQPAAGEKPSVSDFDYQVKYQRAFEAVLWSLPRVQTQGGREATLGGLGIKDNDIVAMSGTATPKFETWTANSSTPYVFAYSDLRREPVVLEVPAAGPDGSLYGQVVDAWQRTIADIGPSGIDAGRGDKLLLTGPDFKGTVPAGYRQVVSPTRRIVFAFRSVRAPGKSAADAYAYARRLKMYYLSQAARPPQQRFADPLNQRYSSLLPQDERYFQLLHDTVTYEPVQPEDKHMLGLLASLGIEQGKPYQPDEKTRRAMRQAVVDVWFYLQQRFDQLPRDYYYWPDRQYVPLLLPDANRGFSFDYPGRIDVDGRALAFFWCTLVPRQVPERPAAYYLMAMADSRGRPLEAGASYRLVVPADMPVKQFWSLTLRPRHHGLHLHPAEPHHAGLLRPGQDEEERRRQRDPLRRPAGAQGPGVQLDSHRRQAAAAGPALLRRHRRAVRQAVQDARLRAHRRAGRRSRARRHARRPGDGQPPAAMTDAWHAL